MLRPVLQYPDPTLAKVSEPVAEINDEIRALAQDLLDTLPRWAAWALPRLR